MNENSHYSDYKNKKRILWIAIGFLILLMLAGVALLLNHMDREDRYTEYLTRANQYYVEQHYEAAIMAYKIAIKEKPKEAETYEQLAQAYIQCEDYENAKEILSEGYKKTGEKRLLKTLERIYLYGTNANAINIAENINNMEPVTINDALFDTVAEWRYFQYVKGFGKAEVEVSADNVLTLFYEEFAGICYYFNTDSNQYIVDVVRQLPYENRKPNYVSFKNLGSLFHNYQDMLSFVAIKELFGENAGFSYNQNENRYELELAYRKCILLIGCDSDGNIVGSNVWNQLIPQYENSIVEEEMIINAGMNSGYITNAVSGSGMKAALIYHEGNSRNGKIVSEIESDYNGNYAVELPEGKYYLEIVANGFITEFFEVTIRKGDNARAVNYTISPILQENEIRIVLEWGSTPRDLDSHLTGRSTVGIDININYTNKQVVYQDNVIAKLDLDDTDGFGPETTTIYDIFGTYEFKVHDFTNAGNSSSAALAESGAVVKVYLGGQQPSVFNVPSGTGTWWTVFRIEEGKVIPVNQIE